MKFAKSGSGRRRWTAKQRQRLLTRFHQSQLTQRDFATRHGVGLSTLSKWLRVEGEAASPAVKFQEVVLPNMPPRYAVEGVGRLPGRQGGHLRALRQFFDQSIGAALDLAVSLETLPASFAGDTPRQSVCREGFGLA
jgi:transcriptional regulator with XRE-family HTH domain